MPSSSLLFRRNLEVAGIRLSTYRSLPLSPTAVPSPQQKTLADYIEGILVIDVDESSSGRRQRSRAAAGGNRNSLSPNLLRRKIEELKVSDER